MPRQLTHSRAAWHHRGRDGRRFTAWVQFLEYRACGMACSPNAAAVTVMAAGSSRATASSPSATACGGGCSMRAPSATPRRAAVRVGCTGHGRAVA